MNLKSDDSDLEYDSDSPIESSQSHLRSLSPEVLSALRRFDISESIEFKNAKMVAQGTYGEVLRATYEKPNGGSVKVAIKRLRFILKKDIIELFEKEVYVWSRLTHSNILGLLGYTFETSTGFPMLVSEWMVNGTAFDYVHKKQHCDHMRLITGIAKGLVYLHEERVVHSDIKPDNIVVTKSGDARICDFGGSRVAAATLHLATPSNGIRGTSRYLAYELVVQSDQYRSHTKKSDVWSFGMTVFALVALQHPYGHLAETQVTSAISKPELPQFDAWVARNLETKEALWKICERCWDHNPTTRIDMASVLLSLSNLQNWEDIMSLDHERDDGQQAQGQPARVLDPYLIRVWDAESDEVILEAFKGHTFSASPVAFSPDGKYIALGSDNNTIRIWDAQTGTPIGEPLQGHYGSVLSVAVSPDGTRIVSASSDRTVRIWDAQTGAPIGTPLYGHLGPVSSIVFSPDARRLVSSSHDKTIRFWDAQTGTPVGNPLQGHLNNVLSVHYSPDGTRIASASSDESIRIWDAQTGAPIGEPLLWHRSSVLSVAFSPDGCRMVSGAEDGTIIHWDAQSGERITSNRSLVEPGLSVLSVAYSPDGSRIVSGLGAHRSQSRIAKFRKEVFPGL